MKRVTKKNLDPMKWKLAPFDLSGGRGGFNIND
jgi:hypothetical protein